MHKINEGCLKYPFRQQNVKFSNLSFEKGQSSEFPITFTSQKQEDLIEAHMNTIINKCSFCDIFEICKKD